MTVYHAFRPARIALLAASLISPALSMAQEPAPHADPSHGAAPTEAVPATEGVAPAAPAAPPEASAPEHGEAAAAEHAAGHGEGAAGEGAASHEGGKHAAGAHHVDYTADDDHDGKANWMDADSDAYVLGGIGQHLFNLVVIGAVLFFVARRPLMDAIKDRAAGIRREVTEAAKVRDEARQRHEDLVKRLSSFEDEVKKLRSDAEADVKAEEKRLTERAHEEAARIGQVAERNIKDELVRAQVALRKEAIDLAVQLAETTLRSEVKSGDQQRLASQFLSSIRQDEGNRNG